MEGFGQFRSVFGGGYPAMIWTDYMAEAMKGKELEDFPARADVGEKKHSAPVIATPTERPEPTDAPEPTSTTIPIPDPTTPTDQPLPTETQTLPEPTRSRFPQPTAPPTDPGIGDGGGDDDGEQ
jgi:hypothetical protein